MKILTMCTTCEAEDRFYYTNNFHRSGGRSVQFFHILGVGRSRLLVGSGQGNSPGMEVTRKTKLLAHTF